MFPPVFCATDDPYSHKQTASPPQRQHRSQHTDFERQTHRSWSMWSSQSNYYGAIWFLHIQVGEGFYHRAPPTPPTSLVLNVNVSFKAGILAEKQKMLPCGLGFIFFPPKPTFQALRLISVHSVPLSSRFYLLQPCNPEPGKRCVCVCEAVQCVREEERCRCVHPCGWKCGALTATMCISFGRRATITDPYLWLIHLSRRICYTSLKKKSIFFLISR